MLNNSSLRLPPCNRSLNYVLAQKMRQTKRLKSIKSNQKHKQTFTQRKMKNLNNQLDTLIQHSNDFFPSKSVENSQIKHKIRQNVQKRVYIPFQNINQKTEKINKVKYQRKYLHEKQRYLFQNLIQNVSSALSEINYQIDKNQSQLQQINKLNNEFKVNHQQIIKRVNFKYAPILIEKSKNSLRKPVIIYKRGQNFIENPISYKAY